MILFGGGLGHPSPPSKLSASTRVSRPWAGNHFRQLTPPGSELVDRLLPSELKNSHIGIHHDPLRFKLGTKGDHPFFARSKGHGGPRLPVLRPSKRYISILGPGM